MPKPPAPSPEPEAIRSGVMRTPFSPMTFKVSMSTASPNTVTAYYYTSDGTATVAR